ncbi:MAG: lysostaphin resistance A-like protein [Opitutaceae bacterium]
MPAAVTYAVGALEVILVGAGALLLWRRVLSPAARAVAPAPVLATADRPTVDVFMFLFLVLTAAFTGSLLAVQVSGLARLGAGSEAAMIVNGAGAQLGMLAGAALFRLRVERRSFVRQPFSPEVLRDGFFTFLISLPVIVVTGSLWEQLLKLLGLPVHKQDLVSLFANAGSPWLLAGMISLAVLVAPVAEEFVFRAGLFRLLRGRVPRAVALFLPATVFATLHVNWPTLQGLVSFAPLLALAVVLSLAYERTGRIGTVIFAHACFNLNTIVVILSGLDP